MEVYLIRHTTPKVAKGVCYGQTDLDLAESYREEFAQVKRLLPSSFDAVYSSPLKRCSQLAHHLSEDTLFAEELKEVNFGLWEMKEWSGINSKELNKWMDDFVHVRPPEGESLIDLLSRTLDFWENLISQKYQQVAICAHAGPIRCILGEVLGVPPQKLFGIGQSYGGVSMVNIKFGQPQVEYINRV